MYKALVVLKYHQIWLLADFKYRVIMYPETWVLDITSLTVFRANAAQLEELA